VKRTLQILLVDDEASIRRSLKMMLEYSGHEVRLAEGGEAALNQLAHHKFDLVITDFLMPDMHGDQLITSIRKLVPTQRIIMATAFVDEYKIYGQASGADALLLKPFTLKALSEAIEKIWAPEKPDATSEVPPRITAKPDGAPPSAP
jgi:CheY-like chemotaxis protein